jgi:outer membrane receptor protein involved in Fe transport
MAKLFFSILFFVFSIATLAQSGTILGTINFKDGKPVDLASVFIENTSFHTYTDEKGFFKLTDIIYGTHAITINYFGKESETVTVNLNSKEVNISHTLSYNETNLLDEVLVNGKTNEAKIETKGFAVNAIKMEEAQLQSIQAVDVLDRSSGVRIRQNGGLGSHIHYNINGLSGNAIRVFINGSPIQSFGPSFSLSSIPTNMIERVEVYKGVVPVELAGDALGGAINVVLKDNFEKNSLVSSYSFGSFNTHQTSVSGNTRNEKTGFTIKGSGFYNYSDNNYKVWGEQISTTNVNNPKLDPNSGAITYITAERFHDTYKSGGLKADIGLTNKTWADELLLGIIYSTLDRDIQHGATMLTVYGNRKQKQNTKLASLSFKDDSFLSKDNLSLELFGSYSHLKRNIIDTIPYKYDWGGELKEQTDEFGNFTGYFTHITGAEAGNPTLEENIEKVYVGRATSHYTPQAYRKLST